MPLLSKATRYCPAGATRCALSPLPLRLVNYPSPQASSARRSRRSFRTASPWFPGQRFPTNQRAGRRPAIRWRCRGGPGPSAFDLKIWRGKPDSGRHHPLAAPRRSAGKPAPRTTASQPLPLARPLPSARELSSSLRGPQRSERRETAAAAAAALPSSLPALGRPGAASLCVPLTCQFTSQLERAESERGLLGTSSPLRLRSPRVRPSVGPYAAPRWVPVGNAEPRTGGPAGGQRERDRPGVVKPPI